MPWLPDLIWYRILSLSTGATTVLAHAPANPPASTTSRQSFFLLTGGAPIVAGSHAVVLSACATYVRVGARNVIDHVT